MYVHFRQDYKTPVFKFFFATYNNPLKIKKTCRERTNILWCLQCAESAHFSVLEIGTVRSLILAGLRSSILRF